VAAALGIGVAVGLGKMWGDVRRWREDQGRDKRPWERSV
jgi:hypothetical protein